MTTPEQIAALRDGRIVGRLHFDDDTIALKVIRKDHLVAALPCDHFLGSR